jgi:hypothetical protein
MLTALLVATLALQEHASWERFAPGSWVEHRITGTREGREVRTVRKTLFRDLTAMELVLGTETTDAQGGRVVGDMKYPLPQREAAPDPETKRGAEELSIGGKTFACEIRERKGVRRWVSADAKVNGGVLKSEAVSGSVKIFTRVTKIGEKVRVGTATVDCWVREDVTETGDQKITRTHWISDEVPGGTVRTEVRQTQGATLVEETTTVLTAFEVVKK